MTNIVNISQTIFLRYSNGDLINMDITDNNVNFYSISYKFP